MLISRRAFATSPVRGSGAPIATHFSKSAMTSGGSLDFGGICRSSRAQRRALRSRLSSALPGMIAGPSSPPVSNAVRVSRKRPPFNLPFAFASAEWHS